MEKFRSNWKKTPDKFRRPTVLIVGICIVLTSGAIGWLPGPGGIPLFLIGIAVLASEFAWAERVRDRILEIIYLFGAQFRKHPVIGWITLIALACCSLTFAYLTFFAPKS